MTTEKNPISLDVHRFKSLASAYGADMEKWPEDARQWAREHADRDMPARELLDYERGLDGALGDVFSDLADADAFNRLREKIAFGTTALPQQAKSRMLDFRALAASIMLIASLGAGMFGSPYVPLEFDPADQTEQGLALLELDPLSSWD